MPSPDCWCDLPAFLAPDEGGRVVRIGRCNAYVDAILAEKNRLVAAHLALAGRVAAQAEILNRNSEKVKP